MRRVDGGVKERAPRGRSVWLCFFTSRRCVLPRRGSPATEPQRRRVVSARAENEAERGGLGGGLMGVLKSARRGSALFGFAFHLTALSPSEARRPCNRAAEKTQQGELGGEWVDGGGSAKAGGALLCFHLTAVSPFRGRFRGCSGHAPELLMIWPPSMARRGIL